MTATEDNNVIKAHVYEETNAGIGRVWINKEQYFDGVPTEAWNMIIAGYKSLEKWLKDRKDKHLTDDEIIHFQNCHKVYGATRHDTSSLHKCEWLSIVCKK